MGGFWLDALKPPRGRGLQRVRPLCSTWSTPRARRPGSKREIRAIPVQ